MISENLYLAGEELKRVDHLIYVSLKYTRTADVIHSVVARMVETYNFFSIGLLEKLKENNKIEEVPKAPRIQINLLKEQFSDQEEFCKTLDFYLFLRKVKLAQYTGTQEFRRKVTMHIKLDDEPVEITIDSVMEYYKTTLDFLDFIKTKELI